MSSRVSFSYVLCILCVQTLNLCVVASAEGMTGGIAVDLLHGRVYWSESTTKTLHSANLNGSDQTLVVGECKLIINLRTAICSNEKYIAYRFCCLCEFLL